MRGLRASFWFGLHYLKVYTLFMHYNDIALILMGFYSACASVLCTKFPLNECLYSTSRYLRLHWAVAKTTIG
jgi:hypothetical protein